MTRLLPARCDFCGRFVRNDWAARHAWFAYVLDAFCPRCEGRTR